jgi:hypothetical protein
MAYVEGPGDTHGRYRWTNAPSRGWFPLFRDIHAHDSVRALWSKLNRQRRDAVIYRRWRLAAITPLPLAHMNRSTRVPEYRISTIGRYGQIVAVKILECVDDKHAIQKAQEMNQGHNSIELRREGRLIKRFGV